MYYKRCFLDRLSTFAHDKIFTFSYLEKLTILSAVDNIRGVSVPPSNVGLAMFLRVIHLSTLCLGDRITMGSVAVKRAVTGVLFYVPSLAGSVCYVSSFDGLGANALGGAWNWMPAS